MVKIDFYNYTGRENAINKTLADPNEMEGLFRGVVNVLQPVITLKHTGGFNYNYCYIRELNRYYFVTGFSVLDNNNVEIRLKLDVLKTYADEILTATGTVFEREDANGFISSRRQIFDVRPNFEKLEFPETGLFDSEGHIIMVTLNGNS